MARFQLPAPKVVPASRLRERVQGFLLRTWRGRLLSGAVVVALLDAAGLPVPGFLTVPAQIILWTLGLVACVQVGRFVLRGLLWKIRTKLILSSLFIAVVPVLLLTCFFLIAGFLGLCLVASNLVSAEIEKAGSLLQASAHAALLSLPADDAAVPAAVNQRLAGARKLHPEIGYAVVRRGRVVAAEGASPRVLPSWWEGPGFWGIVAVGKTEVVRAGWAERDAFLFVEMPLDATVFAGLEARTGIHLLTSGGTVSSDERGVQIRGPEARSPERRSGVRIDVKAGEVSQGGKTRRISGTPFFATSERTDWATGKREMDALTFEFQPWSFVTRLSPQGFDTANFMVKALGVVGVIFLVMYSVALLLGLLLARSITKSVHALSAGTERLRQGDFLHPIQVGSRDQLGELAESFNLMSLGIQDLLREQAEKERLEEELRIARQIQMSLLPAEGAGNLPGLRVAALCLPAAEVGGDYYDLLPLSASRMGVLVADVSGKGTSAALYMAELKGLVLSLSRIYESPAKLLGEANRILAANMDSRSFITMTYAVVDLEARTMRYARAGHNPMIHLEAATGRTQILTPPGLGLGMDAGRRFEEILEEAEVPLRSGDIFLFFTDGLSEAMNSSSELFGERRLREIIEASGAEGRDEGQIKERILEAIRTFVGSAAQHDDMTMVILKVA